MLSVPALGASVREILCLAAHCDDLEIGCGGLIASLRAARPDVRITAVMLSSDETRQRESESALARLAGGRAGLDLRFFRFRDSYFPADWAAVKEAISALRTTCRPDLVLTHWEGDRHQDHRIVSELTWNAFRDHWILEYEIPKWDGDLGRPSMFLPLAAEIADRKVGALMDCFASQAGKPWFTPDTFRGLMRLRGLECRAPSGFAEAFHARKTLLVI
ncbi:MAG TPA: PIG-L deacetylase family protein [Steroidobacteraceae bacterium]|nr:PIG-L deacetylase family protein [Steroidobacteraceae bacterium]